MFERVRLGTDDRVGLDVRRKCSCFKGIGRMLQGGRGKIGGLVAGLKQDAE